MKIGMVANFPDVAKQLLEMQEQVGTSATSRAVNRTMEQGKTAMSRGIRDEFNISASKVNDSLRINKAIAKNGLLEIEASIQSKSGRSLNIINFSARQTAKGVTFQIKRSGGRKVIGEAFIANQGRTVFMRVGKARLPIKAIETINVSQMFNTKRINEKVVALILSKFPEIFEREARFYTDRFNSQRAR